MTQPPEVAVAMDWGGTWVRVAVVNRYGEVLWRSRVRNPVGENAGETRESPLQAALELLHQAIDRSGGLTVAGIGIALAGPVDTETGVLDGSPHLSALNGVSLKALWEPVLGHRIWVGNDANLAALGEFHYGAGRTARSQGQPPCTLVYLTVSTGIGGGVVNRGEIFLGAHGLAAEIGHMVIDRSASAPQCDCGSLGCLEALASGTAIAWSARQRSAYENSIIPSLAVAGDLTSEVVFQAAAQGDVLAQSIVEDVVQALSVGLTNVLHLYDPDLVVLGGGVTEGMVALGLLPRIHSLVLCQVMGQRYKDFRLVPSQLRDAAGLVGAATLVWKGVEASS